MNKYPLELIEWYDAESEVSWADPKDVKEWSKKHFTATEVGFVFYEDNDFIVMVSQIGSDGTIGNRTRIPKPWLKSRKQVTDEPKRRTSRTANNSTGTKRQATSNRRNTKQTKGKNNGA